MVQAEQFKRNNDKMKDAKQAYENLRDKVIIITINDDLRDEDNNNNSNNK